MPGLSRNGITEANELLKKFPLPAMATLKFTGRHDLASDVPGDPYLLLSDGKTRIILRQPFLFSLTGQRQQLIRNKHFARLNRGLTLKFEISQSMTQGF